MTVNEFKDKYVDVLCEGCLYALINIGLLAVLIYNCIRETGMIWSNTLILIIIGIVFRVTTMDKKTEIISKLKDMDNDIRKVDDKDVK